MSEPVVLYEEKGSVAIVTLNRPDKMNTLTEGVVQGVADAIDAQLAPVIFLFSHAIFVDQTSHLLSGSAYDIAR